MQRVVTIIFAGLLSLVSAASVLAETRLALVVGVGNYQAVTSLDNPLDDARLMAANLNAQGFIVTLVTDPDHLAMNRAISQFGRDLRQSGPDTTGLFYYAGHGVQSFGSNYLLPVDANVVDAADLDLVAVQADAVLRQMASARNKTNIVILDACRNNPFESIPALNDNGLAEMNAPRGTYLAYSTAPGSVAFDGDGVNSPFTASLANAMKTPGESIEDIFKAVRVDVLAQTNGQQVPWDTSSLTEDFVFTPAPVLSAAEVAEQQLWSAVEASRDPVQIMLFLRAHPNSALADDARGLLRDVMASELEGPKSAEPTPPAPVAATPTPPVSEVAQSEAKAFDAARADGSAAAYQSYLDLFPQGVFSEIAKVELAALAARATPAPVDPQPKTEKQADAPAVETPPLEASVVAFNQPLMIGPPEVAGRSLAQLVEGSPLFSPIAGIPDEVWKGKTCSSCHNWTESALCTQGGTYLTANGTRALEKSHPYGGGFKKAIRNWAEADCP